MTLPPVQSGHKEGGEDDAKGLAAKVTPRLPGKTCWSSGEASVTLLLCQYSRTTNIKRVRCVQCHWSRRRGKLLVTWDLVASQLSEMLQHGLSQTPWYEVWFINVALSPMGDICFGSTRYYGLWYDISHNICDILQNSHPWSLRLKATSNSIIPLWDLFWMTRVVSQLVLGQNVINFNLLTTKYSVKIVSKVGLIQLQRLSKFDRYGGTLRHQLSNSFWTCSIRKTLTFSLLDLGSSGSVSFKLNQICRTHDFFCRDSLWWAKCCKLVATSVQSWIKLGCCSSAAPSQAWACHGRPGQAGKGQHQPVRVQHFLLQLDTAPGTLPPLHWRHLISSFIFTVLRR